MSIVTTKTVNNTFLDFVDLVDTEASGEDSDEDDTATADKLGISTWPVSFLRQPPTPSDEASTRAPSKNDARCDAADAVEVDAETQADGDCFEVHKAPASPADVEQACWQGTAPTPRGLWQGGAEGASPGLWQDGAAPTSPGLWQDGAEPASPRLWQDGAEPASPGLWQDGAEPASPGLWQDGAEPASSGLWQDDADPTSPCAISMWQTAAASFYCHPPSIPSGVGSSQPLATHPPTAPALLTRANTTSIPAPGEEMRRAAQEAPPLARSTTEPVAAVAACSATSWRAPGEAMRQAAQGAPPLAGSSTAPVDTCASRLQQLRGAAASSAATATLGDALQRAARVATLPAASATSAPYAAGRALAHAASVAVGPLPAASWATLPRQADVGARAAAGWAALPRTAAAPKPMSVAQVRSAAAAQATHVRGAQQLSPPVAGRQQGFRREDPNRLECRRHPARQRGEGEQMGPAEPLEERTTIMLRNIPNNYTRDMLHDLIGARGFGGKCDFLYLPMDFHTQSNLGYAFINLGTAEDARGFWQEFEGFSKWAMRSKKVGSLRWSECQGLDSNVRRYRNSPVMGDAVPDGHKPAIYAGGQRVEFPAPTRSLRAPRLKQP